MIEQAGQYLHWWVLNISLTNILIIAGMILVFVLALVLPFPHRQDEGEERGPS